MSRRDARRFDIALQPTSLASPSPWLCLDTLCTGRRLAWFTTMGLIAFAAACRSTKSRTAAPARTLSGDASYEALTEPDAGLSTLVSQRVFIPAKAAGDNQPPAYPADLVSLELMPQRVVMRLFLDEGGEVVEIRPSEIGPDVDERYRAAFDAAIRAAVARWRFSPALRRTFVDGPDDKSGQRP